MKELEEFQRDWRLCSTILLADKCWTEIQSPDQKFSVIEQVITDMLNEHARLNNINWVLHTAEEYMTDDITSTPAWTDATTILAAINVWDQIIELTRRQTILAAWTAKAVNNERFELAAKIKRLQQIEWDMFGEFAKRRHADDTSIWKGVLPAINALATDLLRAMTNQ